MSETHSCILREEADIGRLYDTLEAELPNGDIEVTWGKPETRRTALQNRWYWEVLSQLEKITGNDKDHLHIYFKHKFLGADQTNILGQDMLITKSTTKLNTKDMSNFIKSVELCASENGYQLIYPNYWSDIQ